MGNFLDVLTCDLLPALGDIGQNLFFTLKNLLLLGLYGGRGTVTKEFFSKDYFDGFKNEPNNLPGGTAVEVHGFSAVRKDFLQPKIHTMSKEVVSVETPPGDIISAVQNPSIPEITVSITFSN
jgi:hypothetical protein